MFARVLTNKNVRKAININHVVQVIQFNDKKTEVHLIGGDVVTISDSIEAVVRGLEAARTATPS